MHAAGLVIKDLPLRESNFRKTQTLSQYLRREGTVAIAGIDTRKLTRHLRTHGAQNGCIVTLPAGAAASQGRIDEAVALARSAPSMAGLDLAKVVSSEQPYDWTETEWRLGAGHGEAERREAPCRRVRLRRQAQHPAHAGRAAAAGSPWCRHARRPPRRLPLRPDGIFLSNGPGDPEPCDYAIEATRELIDAGLPTFGICLGHQILALASGAKTFKMKFGHHGANHPVKDLDTGRVSITSQNHGFAVDEKTLPANLRPTHVSLVRRHAAGPRAHRQARRSASRATRKRAPGRTTSATCSTASSR